MITAITTISLTPDVYMPRKSFIFVRHGRTDWSTTQITQGPANLPLNDLGKNDAEQAAITLNKFKKQNCKIISSELTRAQQTAEIIANKMKQSVNVFPNLHERYFGDFRLFNTLTNNSEDLLPPDAESEESFRNRVFRAFQSTLSSDRANEENKIIVAHGLVFQQLSLLLTGKKQNINYGEVFLFTPNDADETWRIEKLE
jgi:broad specificity phosphatase PhoE